MIALFLLIVFIDSCTNSPKEASLSIKNEQLKRDYLNTDFDINNPIEISEEQCILNAFFDEPCLKDLDSDYSAIRISINQVEDDTRPRWAKFVTPYRSRTKI